MVKAILVIYLKNVIYEYMNDAKLKVRLLILASERNTC